MSSNKELFTRRIYKPLLDAIRDVKNKTGQTHTSFIQQAIDEKLVREGHTQKSLLLNEIDEA